MGSRDRKPPPPDEADGRTQMLKVDSPDDLPEPATEDGVEPVNPDDAPGATAFLKVDAPPPPVKAKRRPPTIEDDPPPAPAADEDAQPTFTRPAPRRPQPPARHKPALPEPVNEGATQMLDLRTVPTPEEMRQQAQKQAALARSPQRKKMPEEIEVPVEHLHEQIHEHAHGKEGHHGGGFNMQVALSSALLAVLAAVSALLSGHYANESMIEQIKASDQWAFYQAKSIKSSVLQAKMETLQGMGRPVSSGDEDKRAQYETEQKDITKKAKVLEEESHHHLNQHQVLARTVTLMQIAIALAAISVLTRKKLLWFLSLAGGAVGALILVQAMFFTNH